MNGRQFSVVARRSLACSARRPQSRAPPARIAVARIGGSSRAISRDCARVQRRAKMGVLRSCVSRRVAKGPKLISVTHHPPLLGLGHRDRHRPGRRRRRRGPCAAGFVRRRAARRCARSALAPLGDRCDHRADGTRRVRGRTRARARHRTRRRPHTVRSALMQGSTAFGSSTRATATRQGDKVLAAAARRLRELCGQRVPMCRMAGDEFAIWLNAGASTASVMARRVAEERWPAAWRSTASALRPASRWAWRCFRSTAAAPVDRPRGAPRCASVKRAGGGSHALFDPRVETEQREELKIAQDLRQAIARHELELVYQPKIDARELCRSRRSRRCCAGSIRTWAW